MGFPKALLAYRGTTFLEHLSMLLAAQRLAPLLVVLGHDADRIRSAVSLPAPVRVMINENYRAGQLSSLQAAIRVLADEPGLLVAPVDHPCIGSEVVQSLLRVFCGEDPDVLVPTHGGRRGHPVIFSRRLFDELLNAPADVGARAVVRRHVVRELPVGDNGVLADIDDPEIYRRLVTAPAGPPEPSTS